MNPDQLIALLMTLADLRLQVEALQRENAALKAAHAPEPATGAAAE